MTETREFTAHLTDEDGKKLQAGISVTAFRPEGNEIVEEVQNLVEEKYEVSDR